MPKKLSSVENFCLFEHMIACLKAFENVVIKQNITTDGMLLASALWLDSHDTSIETAD